MKSTQFSVFTGLLVAACLVVSQTDGWSEGNHHGKRMSAAERAQMLKEKLSLSDEQTAKIQAVHERYEPSEAQKEALRKNFQAKKAEIEAILTPEQLEKLKNLRQDRKAKMQKHHKKHSA